MGLPPVQYQMVKNTARAMERDLCHRSGAEGACVRGVRDVESRLLGLKRITKGDILFAVEFSRLECSFEKGRHNLASCSAAVDTFPVVLRSYSAELKRQGIEAGI